MRAQVGGPLELFFSLKLLKFRIEACLGGSLELLLDPAGAGADLLPPWVFWVQGRETGQVGVGFSLSP
jgi:hypothetical protein